MSNFWPKGFEITDTQSPREILESAQSDWRTESNGLMDLVLQDAESQAGNSMIIVHAKHAVSNRTATLFSIIHRPNRPYPAAIQPKEDELPDFLNKPYRNLVIAPSSTWYGEEVANEWIAATPSEFRDNLSKVFNLGFIKSEMLNLASRSINKSTSGD